MDVSLIPPAPGTIVVSALQGKKFWPRMGAYIIDMLALNAIAFASGFILGNLLAYWFYLTAPVIGRYYYVVPSTPTLLTYLTSFALVVFYFTVFEWLFGRTLGKIILRMHVVSSDGGACSLTQGLTRSLYRLVDGLFFGLIAAVNMKAPTYQRLGDHKAQTVVVAEADPMIKTRPTWWKFFVAMAIYLCMQGTVSFLATLPNIRFVELVR